VTKLRSALPKGDGNGLTAISRALIDSPDQIHVVIALIKTKSLSTEVDSGEVEATAYIRRIEVVVKGDHEVAYRLLERALEKRTGMTTLPFELGEDLRVAFGELDLNTLTAEASAQPPGPPPEPLDDASELLIRAVDLVVTAQNAAVSWLTRQLNIGATKCKQLLEQLQQLGVVSPAYSGSRPRDVLLYPEDLPALIQRIRDRAANDDGEGES